MQFFLSKAIKLVTLTLILTSDGPETMLIMSVMLVKIETDIK